MSDFYSEHQTKHNRAVQRARFARQGIPALGVTVYVLVRDIAMEHGYALAAHGSMARDFDFIAVAWDEEASAVETLVEAIASKLCAGDWGEVNGPTEKPHGRLAFSIILECGAYVDLSVMGPS